jgi:hypothetical protein
MNNPAVQLRVNASVNALLLLVACGSAEIYRLKSMTDKLPVSELTVDRCYVLASRCSAN